MNEQLPVQLSFDVSLPERAQRIRDLVGTARVCIIEIGRELIAAKREVVHGDWLPWLRDEFGWTERTAQKYIAVAQAFGKYELGSHFDGLTIDATALYALSAPDVPQEARDEAVERAEDGEHISKADAEALITEALEVERAKFAAIVAGRSPPLAPTGIPPPPAAPQCPAGPASAGTPGRRRGCRARSRKCRARLRLHCHLFRSALLRAPPCFLASATPSGLAIAAARRPVVWASAYGTGC